MSSKHSGSLFIKNSSPRILIDASRKWDNAVIDFLVEIRKSLDGVFKGLIAYGESEEFYESNVLVILSKIDRETLEKIMEIKFSIEDRYRGEVTISPYIALEGEDIASKIKEASRGSHKGSRGNVLQ